MHHAGSHDLDPARSFAHAAARALARNTRDVHLGARLDEGKEAWPQASSRLFSEESFVESVQRSFQVGERDPFIDQQTLHLMEHRRMCRVEGITPKDSARTNDAQGGLHLFD